MPPLRRADALQILRDHSVVIQERFAVRRLALFGSVAHDEAREKEEAAEAFHAA